MRSFGHFLADIAPEAISCRLIDSIGREELSSISLRFAPARVVTMLIDKRHE